MTELQRCRTRQSGCKWWDYVFLLMITQCFLVNGFTPPSISFHNPRAIPLSPKLLDSVSSRKNLRPFLFDLQTHATTNPEHQKLDSSNNEASSAVPLETKKRLKWKRVLIPKNKEAPAPHHDAMTRTDQITVAATTALGVAAFAYLIYFSGPGAWRYYMAGGICAATSHVIPVPIDVVKTRKQVDPQLDKLSFVEATKEIVRENGVKSLFAGTGPTFWGYMLEGSIKFGVYEILKPFAKVLTKSQLLGFAACATISGFAASLVLCPMEALRIRLVSEPGFAPEGWIQGLVKIVKYEGFGALWKGLKPMMYKQIPYTVTKNVSFDVITRFAYLTAVTRGYGMTTTTTLTIPFLSAVLASILACISSQPGDMLLSLVNAHEGDRRRTRDVVRDILRSDRGVRGFFVGIKTRLLHVGVIVTLQLLIYDYVKRLCGIAATGSV